jgi:hypothetical protein
MLDHASSHWAGDLAWWQKLLHGEVKKGMYRLFSNSCGQDLQHQVLKCTLIS